MTERFEIRSTETLGPDIVRHVVHAPRVSRYARPGQFVIVRVDAAGERIPLTVSDSDVDRGTITLVVQAVGRTTTLLNERCAGDHLADVLGPLGRPTEIERFGTCATIGGGLGTAIVLPVARALADAGNDVVGIVGARDAEHLILIEDMEAICTELIVTTDDGSAGRHGFVTDALVDTVQEGVDYVFAAGPIPMMAAVADATRPLVIKTVVSLNPIMVDGTGMCGGCRVRVGDQTRFACVDGPEFDAHLVDFELLAARNAAYLEFERCRVATSTGAPHG